MWSLQILLSSCATNLTKYRNVKNQPVCFVLIWVVQHVSLCSQYEMELFENEAACQTPLERQYHLDVKALRKARGRRNRRLFTYTDHDRYTNSLPFNQLVNSPIHLSASVFAYGKRFKNPIFTPHLSCTHLYYRTQAKHVPHSWLRGWPAWDTEDKTNKQRCRWNKVTV